MEIEGDYLVRNPKTIVSHLSSIFKNRCILSAEVNEDKSAFFTVINDIDPVSNTIVIDGAPTELLNRQLLNSDKVLFNTQIDGIKVTFAGKDLKKILTGGTVAFQMTIPCSIVWLQRRKYYRVKIPLSHSGSFCQMDNGKTVLELPESHDGTSIFPLADLSISGFAALNPSPEFARLFYSEKNIAGSQLFLHDGTTAKVNFVIKEITEIKFGAIKEQRIGCQFTELNTALESKIQRYMMHLERQSKKLAL